jgi:hypothetical protein
MQTTRRSGRDDAEAVLRAQLGLARAAVDGFAQSATAYWLMWGTLGGPVIQAVETAAEAQRRYLDTLRSTLRDHGEERRPRSETPQREPLRHLLHSLARV